jgi:NADP-dependent 3-hydroxy acid dehydrogenase YdfG
MVRSLRRLSWYCSPTNEVLLTSCSAKDYIDNFTVNVCDTINVTRAILPQFRFKSRGTIIFIGSRSGWEGDMGAAPYNATKYALEGLSSCSSAPHCPPP